MLVYFFIPSPRGGFSRDRCLLQPRYYARVRWTPPRNLLWTRCASVSPLTSCSAQASRSGLKKHGMARSPRSCAAPRCQQHALRAPIACLTSTTTRSWTRSCAVATWVTCGSDAARGADSVDIAAARTVLSDAAGAVVMARTAVGSASPGAGAGAQAGARKPKGRAASILDFRPARLGGKC